MSGCLGSVACFDVAANRQPDAEGRRDDRPHAVRGKIIRSEMHSLGACRQSHIEAIVDVHGNLDDAHDPLGGATQLGGVTVSYSDLNSGCPTTDCGTASVQDILPLIKLRRGHGNQAVIWRHN